MSARFRISSPFRTRSIKTILPPCQRQHGELEVGSDNGTLLRISSGKLQATMLLTIDLGLLC